MRVGLSCLDTFVTVCTCVLCDDLAFGSECYMYYHDSLSMFSSDLLIKIFVRHVLTSYFSLALAGNNTIKVVRFGKV